MALEFSRHLILLFLAFRSLVGAAAADSLDTWQLRTPRANTNYLNSVIYGQDRFVAVGDEGTILYSTDGANWEAAPKVTTRDLHTVIFANGRFVIGGADRLILTSTNGVSWQPALSGTLGSLFCGTYGNGQYLFAGSRFLVSSSTGESWTFRTQPFPQVMDGLTYGNGKFVGVGWDSDTYAAALFTSTDGAEWTPRDPKTSESLNGAAYGDGVFVIAGDRGAIATSPDGDTWTPRTTGTENTLWDVEYGNRTFVTVGWDGTILSSRDGADWTLRPSPTTNALYGVTYGNKTFVAVGRFGTIVQSAPLTTQPDGVITLFQPSRQGQVFSFRFNAESGQSYQVQASENLTAWKTLTTVHATGSTAQCELNEQGHPNRTYRVVKP